MQLPGRQCLERPSASTYAAWDGRRLLGVLKPAYAFPSSLPVFSFAAHYFSNSGGEVCEENTLASPKVSLFPGARRQAALTETRKLFRPKARERFMGDAVDKRINGSGRFR